MTIREIEEQLGLPRATVRYYEREGLLSPARGGNNYRDYTAEDVATLEKICLLRQLDMPLDTIRAVQRGEVRLREALERQEKLLGDGEERLRRASELCRSLLRDGVTYPELDAGRYRQEPALSAASPAGDGAEGTGQGEAPPPAPTANRWLPELPPLPEGAVWAYNPWQRFWARCLDIILAELVVVTALALLFRIGPVTNETTLVSIGTTVLTWVVVFLAEPTFLALWGTTPGKWLLGLRLEDDYGRKLTWGAGFLRCWGVLVTGFGLHIPIFALWRGWKCYKACREEEPLSYDQENRYYSRVGDRWRWRAAGAVVLTLALAVAGVLASFWAILPPNRGELTRQEFYANVSALSDQSFWTGSSLSSGPMWIDEEGYLLNRQKGVIIEDGQGRLFHYGDRLEDAPLYTLEVDEGGFVTAVTLTWEADWDVGLAVLPVQRATLATAAFQGSRMGAFELMDSPILEALGQMDTLPNGTPVPVSGGGFTATLTLERDNCRIAPMSLIYPVDEGRASSCRFTFRLEKTE